MTDADLVRKKLARIGTCVAELRTHIRTEEIETDLRAERFAEHTLQLAVQAAIDVGSHLVSADRLGEPRTNREVFELLARGGWIPPAMVPTLSRMVGLRNLLVHGYDAVDARLIRAVVESGLPDLEAFVAAVHARLDALE